MKSSKHGAGSMDGLTATIAVLQLLRVGVVTILIMEKKKNRLLIRR